APIAPKPVAKPLWAPILLGSLHLHGAVGSAVRSSTLFLPGTSSPPQADVAPNQPVGESFLVHGQHLLGLLVRRPLIYLPAEPHAAARLDAPSDQVALEFGQPAWPAPSQQCLAILEGLRVAYIRILCRRSGAPSLCRDVNLLGCLQMKWCHEISI